jgi:cation diffusion facilitator CzcD-associated flavoprotein CzcO
LKDHPAQEEVRNIFTGIMHERLHNDPDLIKQLVPDFHVGCRRITPSDGYLSAIQSPNASFSYDTILQFTETGIQTEAGNEEFDLIICATGFDTSFRPYWEVVGQNAISLNEKWKEEADAYLGICEPDMPNYFMFVGPNSPVGHGDSLACQEWTAEYILKWCRKIATEDIRYDFFAPFSHCSSP